MQSHRKIKNGWNTSPSWFVLENGVGRVLPEPIHYERVMQVDRDELNTIPIIHDDDEDVL